MNDSGARPNTIHGIWDKVTSHLPHIQFQKVKIRIPFLGLDQHGSGIIRPNVGAPVEGLGEGFRISTTVATANLQNLADTTTTTKTLVLLD